MNKSKIPKGSRRPVAYESELASPILSEEPDDGPIPPGSDGASAIDKIVKILTTGGGEPPPAADWREIFLQTLSRAPIVTVAAQVAGIPRAQAVGERKFNADFARRWDDAMVQGIDQIEAAAFLGAVYGEEKPVFYRGKLKGRTVKFSYAMRSMLLKARRPDVFAPQRKSKKGAKENGVKPLTLAEFRQRMAEVRREQEEDKSTHFT